MVNCSNCDCSKNLLDKILLLLNTIRAIIFFLVICSNPVNLWGLTKDKLDSSSLTFRKKKFDCSTVICSTLLAGKYQLLDTIYSKENGVHVRQLG